MNGVPGVMALESQASLSFSSSLMTLPIADKCGICKTCMPERGMGHTFPFGNCQLASFGLILRFLGGPETTRTLLVHLCAGSNTV